MESQSEWFEGYLKYRGEFEKAMPKVWEGVMALRDAVYSDGALNNKTKRLMAMAIAVRIGCTGCILGQTKLALQAGATKEEVLEAISVAIAMGGTPSVGWSWRVIKLLEELGKW